MSDVSICNLALSFIGDAAQVTSITPPDGTVQAGRCAQFYPQARRVVLQAHPWGFATKRQTLTDVGSPSGSWAYRYALPSDALRLFKILNAGSEAHEPSEPFVLERSGSVTTVLTDAEEAEAVYVLDVTDTTRFSPMVEVVVARLLASYLAGPTIRGKAGANESTSQYKLFLSELAQAMAADATSHKPRMSGVQPPSIAARS